MKELFTLVDVSKGEGSAPAIDIVAFPNTSADFFWSSSPVADDPGKAWDVSFASGGSNNAVESIDLLVRCVR